MRDRIRERFRGDTELSSLPDHALLGIINIPGAIAASPWSLIGRRVLYAFLLLFLVALIVYLDARFAPEFALHLFAPLGATAVLVFAVPTSPLA